MDALVNEYAQKRTAGLSKEEADNWLLQKIDPCTGFRHMNLALIKIHVDCDSSHFDLKASTVCSHHHHVCAHDNVLFCAVFLDSWASLKMSKDMRITVTLKTDQSEQWKSGDSFTLVLKGTDTDAKIEKSEALCLDKCKAAWAHHVNADIMPDLTTRVNKSTFSFSAKIVKGVPKYNRKRKS